MRILKYLFFLLLIVFIGGAIYFATKDGNYQIESSKVINAPVEVIFKKVNDLKSWEEWGAWQQNDSTVVFNYPEKTTGEGANFSWNGKDWDGSITTTNVIPDSTINQDMTSKTPTISRKSDIYWNFEKVAGGTKVTWGLKGEHGLKDKAYLALSRKDFRGEMQKFLTQGLDALDSTVQKDLKIYTITTDGVTQYGGGFYMYASTATKLDALSGKTAKLIPKIRAYMDENSIGTSGNPMTIYNTYEPENNSAIISCAIPTTTRVVVPENSEVLCSFMPAQTVVKTTLKGNYKNLGEAWNKAMNYLKENDYEPASKGNQFEIYRKGPLDEPNPAEWITELYIPIKTEATSTSNNTETNHQTSTL